MHIRMKVIPEQDDRRIEALDGTASHPVVISGDGPHSFLCGSCGVVLVEGVRFGQVESVSFRCGACRSLNAIPRIMGGDGASEEGG